MSRFVAIRSRAASPRRVHARTRLIGRAWRASCPHETRRREAPTPRVTSPDDCPPDTRARARGATGTRSTPTLAAGRSKSCRATRRAGGMCSSSSRRRRTSATGRWSSWPTKTTRRTRDANERAPSGVLRPRAASLGRRGGRPTTARVVPACMWRSVMVVCARARAVVLPSMAQTGGRLPHPTQRSQDEKAAHQPPTSVHRYASSAQSDLPQSSWTHVADFTARRARRPHAPGKAFRDALGAEGRIKPPGRPPGHPRSVFLNSRTRWLVCEKAFVWLRLVD